MNIYTNANFTSTKVVPYVYYGIHKETKQFYIGYKKNNKEPSSENLGNQYKTSSKKVKPIFDEFDWHIVAEFINPDRIQAAKDAYAAEQLMIYENWGNPLLLNKSCYHSKEQFNTIGRVPVRTKIDSKVFLVSVDDPRYINGELVGVTIGKVSVKDKLTGETSSVSIFDQKYISGELVSINKGKIPVKHITTGETSQVSVNDPRYLSGELVSMATGKVIVKDKLTSKISMVSLDDPDYINGKLVFINTDKFAVVDKLTGKTSMSSLDDPRYLSGELISVNKGKVTVIDKNADRIIQVSITDPRYISGELVSVNKGRISKMITCPHCGKTGGLSGMKRYHFNHCSLNKN